MPQDNAGNNLFTARNIGIPGSNDRIYQDYVGGSDGNDYYRFVLPQTQNFRASLAGLSADADIEVLDLLGQRVRGQQGISQNGGTASESINLDGLGAGIYHIRVYPFSGNTDYTLSVRAENRQPAPPDFAGNNLFSSRNIGFLGLTNQIYRDWVGSADGNDYYRFLTTSSTNFRLNLDGLSGDADVELLNQFGSVIRRSMRGGNNSESISVDGLDAGIYHVRVYPYGGADTYYNLRLRAEAPPPDYAGNNLLLARNIGSLSYENQIYTDWVGSADRDDYYRFVNTSRTGFQLTVSGLSADADVELLNQWGQVISQSNRGGSNSETINVGSLDAGIYHIRVYRYGNADTSYNLSLQSEPGSTLASSRNISTLRHLQTVSYADSVGSSDMNDYYRFNLAGQSNLRLNLSGLNADADIELIGENGQVLRRSILGGNASETIFWDGLGAGNYYARVYQYQGNTNYNLSFYTEYTRVDGTVRNRGPLLWDDVETRPVNISSFSDQRIENRETWVVIHGHRSDTGGFIGDLANAIAQGHQVILLDWSRPADNNQIRPDLSARWVHEVANFAVQSLRDIWGIATSNINLIGHSLGSYVASEIGSIFTGANRQGTQVNQIIALDPARSSSAGGYDIDGLANDFQPISNFNDVSTFARAFWGDALPIPNIGEGLGSARYAHSADESFQIEFESSDDATANHNNIVRFFTNMLREPNNAVSRLFQLDRRQQSYWETFEDDEGFIIVNGQNRPDKLYFLTPPDNWVGAQNRARSAGGNLVTINDLNEQNWLVSTFNFNHSLWIGLTDSSQYGASEGDFRWVSGQPVTYTRWAQNEPNNVLRTPEGEDFVEMLANGRWNDLPYNWMSTYGIAEVA